MNRNKQQIELLCKAISKLRAGGRCEICGATAVEQHNILFGSSTTDPRGFCDPDLYACLCSGHHRDYPEAAHQNREVFLAVYLANIEPERVSKIVHAIETPRGRTYIDYPAVRRQLTQEYKELEATAWMDNEIDAVTPPGYRYC